jgi:hypothetical protein
MWIALMKTIGRAPLKDTRTLYFSSEKENKDAFSAPHDQNNRIDKSDNSVK